MSDLLPVTQADRDAVQAFHRIMAARLMSDIANGRPTMGEDEGDAGTLVQAFAAHRLAALDSRAGDAGEGDQYTAGYAQGQADAAQLHHWMQDKAWQDAVLMLVHYQTLAERTWLVGHEEAAAKLAEWWRHARALSETKSAEDIAATPAPAADAADERASILRQAAQEAYRVCAETRHVSLGEKARDTILAMQSQDSVGLGKDNNGGRCPDCDDTGDVHRIDGEWLGTCHCPAGKGVSGDAAELAAFGASEHACALYPGEDQAAERAAFIAGATHQAKPAVDAVPAGEVDTYSRWLAGDETLPTLPREQYLRFQASSDRAIKNRRRTPQTVADGVEEVRRNPDDPDWDNCPACKGGALDTGYECNTCGFDAQPLVHLKDACEARGERMHPSGLYESEIAHPFLAALSHGEGRK